MSLRLVWSTERVLGKPGLYRETLSWGKRRKKVRKGGKEGGNELSEHNAESVAERYLLKKLGCSPWVMVHLRVQDPEISGGRGFLQMASMSYLGH